MTSAVLCWSTSIPCRDAQLARGLTKRTSNLGFVIIQKAHYNIPQPRFSLWACGRTWEHNIPAKYSSMEKNHSWLWARKKNTLGQQKECPLFDNVLSFYLPQPLCLSLCLVFVERCQANGFPEKAENIAGRLHGRETAMWGQNSGLTQITF